jgi:short-subunit dehydrogenase
MQRIAVVTGASSGIGEATARALTAHGWRCVLVARREDLLRALADEIVGEVEVCDVSDRAAVEALAKRVLERHPAIHVLVNNAGMPARGTFLKADLDLIERVIRVNYLGGVWCTRAFMPGLEASAAQVGDAHVVNMVSVAGTVSFAPAGGYAASKHAQLAFSRSLGAALKGTGIHVHSIMPGFVETEGFPQKGVLKSRLMLRFVIEVDEVADAVVKAIEKNKAEVVIPWFPYRLVGIAQAVVPGVVARFVGMSDYRQDKI